MRGSPPGDLVARLRSAGCVRAEDEARLLRRAATGPAELDAMAARRVAGEPLEHVLGWAVFRGLRVAVEPGVFVPRHRSELLVEQAVRQVGAGSLVVDLCCGSGALGLAITAAVPGVRLHAADLDPVAVTCARRNLAEAGGIVHQGDLYEALPADLRGRVDVLVVNAPYVPTDAVRLMPREARLHEARVALDGGPDGLDVQRRVVEGARDWLAPAGSLLLETSAAQTAGTAGLMVRAGLSPRVVSAEDATVVIGTS